MHREEDGLQKIWESLVEKLEERFGEGIDFEGMLYLVGLQELGKGPVKLSKSQKMDAIHVAVCTLLAPYGYYNFVGEDADGWPHYEETEILPALTPGQQNRLIKGALIEYFRSMEIIP